MDLNFPWNWISALDVSFFYWTSKLQIFGWEKHREKSDTFWVKKSASRHFENKKLLGKQYEWVWDKGVFWEITFFCAKSTTVHLNRADSPVPFLIESSKLGFGSVEGNKPYLTYPITVKNYFKVQREANFNHWSTSIILINRGSWLCHPVEYEQMY